MTYREIEFRGVPYLDTSSFIYGAVHHINPADTSVIIIQDNGARFACDPESIGQYIGIKDVTGKKIYKLPSAQSR